MDFFDFLKNNKFIFLMISIIMNILLGGLCGFLFYQNITFECKSEVKPILLDQETKEEVANNFFVEIKGAVKNPGVYEASSANIINDIVSLAGGFTKKAYTKNINLSRKVTNELVIYVFTESEYKKNNTKVVTKIVQSECECSNYDISNCTDNKVSEIVSSNKDTSFGENNDTTTESNSTLININNASKEELMNLSGIGESKAKDIIEYRNNVGLFKSIEEIKNVSGIGDALYTKIKDNITI